ncbi:hypothetical protein GF358_02980 [Candidatus Woesearchaeota archaeon]|nr:hypothetical protein [Candidatus Woesearchaeota archaeon]
MNQKEFVTVAVLSVIAITVMTMLVLIRFSEINTGMAPVDAFLPADTSNAAKKLIRQEVPIGAPLSSNAPLCQVKGEETIESCTEGYSSKSGCEYNHKYTICVENNGKWYVDNDCNDKVHCADKTCIKIAWDKMDCS